MPRGSSEPSGTPPLVGSFTTVADAMDAAAAQHGSHDAYVEEDNRLSFSDWIAAADSLAGALYERGVRPGDVVAMCLPSSIDYAISYAAIVRAGAVATGLNPRLGPREVSSIIAQSGAQLAIADAALERTSDVAALLPGVIWRSELSLLYQSTPLGARRPSRQAEDPAVIIWTSGTTGQPKGACFDHRNLEAAVASAGVMSAPFDRRLVGTPFPHAGYMAKLWDQLAWGSTVVINRTPWTAGDMLDLIIGERITVAGGVPTQWSKLLEHPGISDADLSHVRICLAATAPASPDLIRQVTKVFGCPLIVRYAMTESPSITGTEPEDPPEVLAATVGRPQRGVEVIVVDEDGAPLQPGEIGRVRVRGACVMRGYWKAPEMTSRVLGPDGWLMSSDLGSFDHLGNLVLAGRVDDMYLRGGYNVYPVEVEHVLTEHPDVARAAVVGVPTAVIGEIGVAFIVAASAERTPSLQELRVWAKKRLADYKAPDDLRVVSELPLTPMLKVDKTALRAMVQADR